MKNSIKLALILVILAVVGGILYWKRGELIPVATESPQISASPSVSATPRPITDLILVSTPKSNDLVDPSKPLLIEGTARGNWYFEASFPVKLIDANGNILSQDSIQTDGDWMTENFVPFKKTLQFAPPSTLTGTLILERDNPSGLPENDMELRIPLRFNIPSTSVKVFFGNEEKNPGALDCSLAFSVTRTIPKTTEVARVALEELLKGVTQEEKNAGYFTSINNGVKIKSLTITNGVAKVDFDKALEQNVGGSCRVTAIRSQITQTLMQFSTVKSVIISIDGRTEDILQP